MRAGGCYLPGGVPTGGATVPGVPVPGTGGPTHGGGAMAGGVVSVRNTRRQKQIVADLRARRDKCWLCAEPIDYEAVPPAELSFSADHIKPWSKFPELREDPANYAAAHLGCNKKRGNREAPAGLGLLSREW